jgi:hypothetical protein
MHRRKIKKKFIKKIFIQKSIPSLISNQYLNTAFLKFYKLYIAAKQPLNLKLTSQSYNLLNKLMITSIQNFRKRYVPKRRKILKVFYKLLKKRKPRRYKK